MFAAIGIFFLFLLLGMPVAFSIALSGFSFFVFRDLPMTVLVQKSISTSQSFTMLAIPLFILAGNLMNSCGITSRLMKFANSCTGHMYGNIGQVSCLMSTLMGGVSGSAVADTTAVGSMLLPIMTGAGYDRAKSTGIVCSAGCIGCKLCTKVCPRDAILPIATAEEKEKYKAIKKAQAEKAKAAAEAKAAETAQ